MNENWFYVNDTNVSKNNVRLKFTFSSADSTQCSPYLLIYKKCQDIVPSLSNTISDEDIQCTSSNISEPISVHLKRKRM